MLRFTDIPVFWQGVLSSIVATIFVAIAVALYRTYSRQARLTVQRRQTKIENIVSKVRSADSVFRVEGYFAILFTLLKYLFIANILWVAADVFNAIAYPAGWLLTIG